MEGRSFCQNTANCCVSRWFCRFSNNQRKESVWTEGDFVCPSTSPVTVVRVVQRRQTWYSSAPTHPHFSSVFSGNLIVCSVTQGEIKFLELRSVSSLRPRWVTPEPRNNCPPSPTTWSSPSTRWQRKLSTVKNALQVFMCGHMYSFFLPPRNNAPTKVAGCVVWSLTNWGPYPWHDWQIKVPKFVLLNWQHWIWNVRSVYNLQTRVFNCLWVYVQYVHERIEIQLTLQATVFWARL